MRLGLRGLRIGIATGFIVSFALVPTSSASPVGVSAEPPRVTLIGDSIADAFDHNADAVRILGQGIELKLEVAACRRIAPDSCTANGVQPLTVLELVKARGTALGSTVIVSVGYNDWEDEYARNIENALEALEKEGVTRVLWPTLRAARHPYLTMNEAIKAAAERHPQMTVVDWNVYSRSHPDWFQEDGIHVNGTGVVAMATLFRQALVDLSIPLPPVEILTGRLRDARMGVRYSARLSARGGKEPYRWSFRRVPPGLHASAAGRLSGVPRLRTGPFDMVVTVVDSLGETAVRRIPIRVRR